MELLASNIKYLLIYKEIIKNRNNIPFYKGMSPIVLASSSPRRKKLLKGLLNNFGLKFKVKPANIEKYIENFEDFSTKSPKFGEVRFSTYVKDLARKKALHVSKFTEGVIIGADTIVVYNNCVVGKPRSPREAVKTLKLLSGKWHRVFTGLSIIDTINEIEVSDFEMSRVKFRKLANKEIQFYVKSGSPFDKAGSYGIQDDFGSTFVEKIEGDYFNIVGLPLMKTYLGLKKILKLEL